MDASCSGVVRVVVLSPEWLARDEPLEGHGRELLLPPVRQTIGRRRQRQPLTRQGVRGRQADQLGRQVVAVVEHLLDHGGEGRALHATDLARARRDRAGLGGGQRDARAAGHDAEQLRRHHRRRGLHGQEHATARRQRRRQQPAGARRAGEDEREAWVRWTVERGGADRGDRQLAAGGRRQDRGVDALWILRVPPPAQLDAVEVHRERADRGVVRSGRQLLRVDLRRAREERVVDQECALDARDPRAGEALDQRAERIGVELRIAAAAQDEIALEHAVVDGPGGVEGGGEAEPGAQRVERGQRGRDLLGRRGDERRVAAVLQEYAPARRVEQHDAEIVGLEAVARRQRGGVDRRGVLGAGERRDEEERERQDDARPHGSAVSLRKVDVGAAADERQIEVGPDAGLGAAHVGDRVHAVHRRGDDAAVALRAPRRWRPDAGRGSVSFTGGSPRISTSKRSPSGPKVHGGSRCSSPMNQLMRTVMNGSPPTVPSQVKRCAATRPGRDRADRRVDRRGRDGDLVPRGLLGIERDAQLGGHHVDRLEEAAREELHHRTLRRLLGRLAEQHDVADDVGRRVGADVGELLGAHVRDASRQRRDHQREALGDAAGVDAGAVERGAARPGTPPRAPRRPAIATGRTSRAA